MNAKKKFTFADWKKGKIYKALKDKSIEGFDFKTVHDVGWFPTLLYENHFIDLDEYKKIDQAQKETFYLAVEQNVRFSLHQTKARMESAYAPKKLLLQKIRSLKKQIDSVPDHYLQKAYAGDWSKSMISNYKHRQLTDERINSNPNMSMNWNTSIEDIGRSGIKERIDFRKEVPMQDNHLLNVTVTIRLLDEYELLLEENYSEKSVKDSISREDILRKAHQYKQDGMKVNDMFQKIKEWLFDDLDFNNHEMKKTYGFELKDPDSFNRFVNKNPTFNN